MAWNGKSGTTKGSQDCEVWMACDHAFPSYSMHALTAIQDFIKKQLNSSGVEWYYIHDFYLSSKHNVKKHKFPKFHFIKLKCSGTVMILFTVPKPLGEAMKSQLWGMVFTPHSTPLVMIAWKALITFYSI